MENLFRITFHGQIRPGAHPDLVRSLIATRMKLSPPQVERMFCGRKVILKNTLPEAEATAFLERLNKLGMIASLESMPAAAAIPETVENLQATQVPTLAPSTAARDEALEAASTPASRVIRAKDDTPALETERPPYATNPRLEESWLTQSSYANLARTHLNLDRAEALLNVASPIMPRAAEPEPDPAPPPPPHLFDGEDIAPLLRTPHQPVQVVTEFSCTHCGTTHRIELNITQLDAPAQIRTRQDRASA